MLSLKAHCSNFIIGEEIQFKREEVPTVIFEDLRKLNSFKNLLIKEQLFLRKMKIIECNMNIYTYEEELYTNMLEEESIWCFDMEKISDLNKKKSISKKNKDLYLSWREKMQSDLNQIISEQECTLLSIAEEYQKIKFKLDFENIPIFDKHDDVFLNEIL